VLVRWVGGRGVAQLSLIEFLLVIAPGSAVGDALFYPEVPLLHAMLRLQGVANLGEVRCAYLESNGAASVFRHDSPRQGLPIMPPPELARRPVPKAGGAVCRACCGQGVTALASDIACPNCGAKDWTRPA
jgi:uncharacterized membrane protein YcaP (DUF421 family)